MKQHVITALVENKQGVLARIVGVISGRGFNIDSLNVAPTQDPTVSRMTIRVPGDDRVLEQVTKQLNRLIDVIKVSDLTKERFIDRELVIIKVAVPPEKRTELTELAALLKAQIVSVQPATMVVQMAGDQEEIANLVKLLQPFKIADICRTGVVAMSKSDRGLTNGGESGKT